MLLKHMSLKLHVIKMRSKFIKSQGLDKEESYNKLVVLQPIQSSSSQFNQVLIDESSELGGVSNLPGLAKSS